MPEKHPSTPEEAIWDIRDRLISVETTLRGTPNTKECGLVGEIQDVKALAVEVKDANIEQGKNVAWLMARCRVFHNGGGDPNGEPNPLKKVPKKKIFGFISTLAFFLALFIYNLGGAFGWWNVK